MANRADAAVAEFWRVFGERAAELATTDSADTPVYDELLEQLQMIDPGLFFEFAADPGGCELIVTADGERSLFALARSVVAAAPPVEGWKIQALRPKLGFPRRVRWEGVELDLEDLVFEGLELDDPDELGLRIFVPGLDEEDEEDAHNAILRAMDHGLGEEALAESVHYTEVAPLPEDGSDEFIPLVELERFLELRAKQRAEGAKSPA